MNDAPNHPATESIAPAMSSSGGVWHGPKVLLVNRALSYHVPGGLERHVVDLALGLAAAGCQVHLLCAELSAAAAAPLEEAGVALHACPEARPRRYTLRYLAAVGRHIGRLQRKHHFDLIHGQEFALGFYRPSPGDPPVILTVHGTITSETPLHQDVYARLGALARCRAWMRFGRRLLFAPVWRRSLRLARRVLVDSEFTRRELCHIDTAISGRVRMVPLAVRATGPAPMPKDEARAALGWRGIQLLTIGRLEWQKGHDLALRALAGLKHLDWHYTIAGSGPQAESIQSLVRQLHLEGRVDLTGRVGEEVKQRLLAGADLFLWPERTHPAFGLVGLEAMLCRTPVLATARGAIPEVLGETGKECLEAGDARFRGVAGGWLVAQPSVNDFREALESLLTHPGGLAAVDGQALRERALERFSFERHIEATLAVYRDAMGPGKG